MLVVINNKEEREAMAKTLEQVKTTLAEEKAKNGCKPVYGGHGVNCRCFTMYLRMKEVEHMIAKAEREYNQAITDAKEFVSDYLENCDWENRTS